MASRRSSGFMVVVVAGALAAGCAAYRTDSNIETPAAPTASSAVPVLIQEGSLPNRKYRELGPIEVSVKKLTVFHADPTKVQANEALIERARAMGADAVINVTYTSGVGLTTWGYMDAKGIGVKLAP